MTSVSQTSSWPEFFARAKKVGEVQYKTNLNVSGQTLGNYSTVDEDDRGQRRTNFTTFADADNKKYLTQLKIAGIKVNAPGEGSLQEANDFRIDQLESRITALETTIQELSSRIKPVGTKRKKK